MSPSGRRLASAISSGSVVSFRLGPDHDHQGGAGDQDDRLQRLLRVGLHVLVQVRIDHHRPLVADQQRVAVRLGGRDGIGGDVAGGPRPVLHHDRAAQRLFQRLGEHARDGVGAAAGRIGQDQPDRPARIALLGRRSWRQCGCARCKQKGTAIHTHEASSVMAQLYRLLVALV